MEFIAIIQPGTMQICSAEEIKLSNTMAEIYTKNTRPFL